MTEEIEQVRSFNRTVTERIGALNDRYLGRDRPLGEARLLWEIGEGRRELTPIREALGIDPGYLSRLLRSLETDGLLGVEENPRDRRARIVYLTALGRRERSRLDEHSNALAASLLDPFGPKQRQRVVTAMAEVERLMTAAAVEIVSLDSEHPHAQSCLARYGAELNRRSTRLYDPLVGTTALPHEVRSPAGEFFVAYLHGEPIGCGAVKHHDDEPAEIKRMWIAPAARGLGLGRRLLGVLESCARDAGADIARLETSTDLGEAVSLYESAGWVRTEAFNEEPFADRWFEKDLTRPAPTSSVDARRID